MIGTRRPGADALDHVGAVHVGQAEIDDDHVDRPQRRRADGFGAGAGFVHDEAVELEAGAQEPADLHLVIDDEHDRGLAHSSASLSSCGTAACVTGSSIGHRRAQAGAIADRAHLAAIGGDKRIGDPEAEAGAAGRWRRGVRRARSGPTSASARRR